MAKKKPRRSAGSGPGSNANDAAHHSTASGDPHADRTRRRTIRSRPASSETVFAVREFMAAASGDADADASSRSAQDQRLRLGAAPLPSLPRLLEQLRILSRESSSASGGTGGVMDATILILSDLWEEASSMKHELDLARGERLAMVDKAEEYEAEEYEKKEEEEDAGVLQLTIEKNRNPEVAKPTTPKAKAKAKA